MIGAVTVAEDCGWWNMSVGIFGYLIEHLNARPLISPHLPLKFNTVLKLTRVRSSHPSSFVIMRETNKLHNGDCITCSIVQDIFKSIDMTCRYPTHVYRLVRVTESYREIETTGVYPSALECMSKDLSFSPTRYEYLLFGIERRRVKFTGLQ